MPVLTDFIETIQRANPLVFVWLAFAAGLLVYSWRGWRHAAADRRAQRASGKNGPMKIEADGAYRSNVLWLGMALLALATGLVALVTPPIGEPIANDLAAWGRRVARWVVPGGVAAVLGVALAIKAHRDWYDGRVRRALRPKPGGRRAYDPPREGAGADWTGHDRRQQS